MTRTSHQWKTKPGSFDALHATQLFPSDNRWGIPNIQHTSVENVPKWLVPYRQQIRTKRSLDAGAVHFFLDDYRFESVWNRPNKTLTGLQKYQTLLTPDFSLYRDWPIMLQMWNTYRSRWVGCLWQHKGFTVIPTVSWSVADSYAFCFAGLPKRSLVAISSLGINFTNPVEHHLFVAGFHEMLRQLQPLTVLSYGTLPAECNALADVMHYPTRWTSIRAAQKQAMQIQEADGRTR
ncbi:MAG: DUF4417 domain-containing protein [Candidatus Promineifilaceae bacterium]